MLKSVLLKGIAVAVLLPALLCAQSLKISVKNNAEFTRKQETVEVNLSQLVQFKNIDPKLHVVVSDTTGQTVFCSQEVDLNADGIAEQLVFQADFKPLEDKYFVLKFQAAPPAGCDAKTFGSIEYPREDYAWENDHIAFRMYGPALRKEVNNGFDVWCKRVRYPIVAKWYKAAEGVPAGKDPYHHDTGEGADFFSVGRTLGAGSSAIHYADSLHQPGAFSCYRTICSGPIRTCFEVYYDTLYVNGALVREVKRITLDAGSNLNRVEVSYTFDSSKLGKPLTFATGLVKRKNAKPYRDSVNCWLSLWGLTNDDSTNGYLGTGIVIPAQSFAKFGEDAVQYFAFGKTNYPAMYTYYSGASWSRQGDHRDEDEWNAYLKRFAERLEKPLIVFLH